MVSSILDLNKYRIIMVFGSIGHGKSTTLNALGAKFLANDSTKSVTKDFLPNESTNTILAD